MNKFSIKTSFAISAGAGSGKTYTLSRRFINILLGFDFFVEEAGQEHYYSDRETKKADLRQIVTITYTEAAALEMKERIFGLIHKILHADTLDAKDGDLKSIALAYEGLEADAKGYIHARLNQAIEEMGEANITTIHGFCLGILKRHADVAKIDGKLDVISEEDKKQLFQKIYFDVVNDEAYQSDILTITKNVSLYKSLSLIERYVFEHKFRHSIDHYFHGNGRNIKEILINIFLEPLSDMIDEAMEELKGDPKLSVFALFVKKIHGFEYTPFSECAKELGIEKASLGAKKYPVTDEVKKTIEALGGYFSVVDEAKEGQFSEVVEVFRKLLNIIKTRYDEAMSEEGNTDFDTIIQRAAAIIARVESDYKYIMVDEFQDTNAIQWEIVKRAGERANLFVVGDEKQSIYAFQGGEIEVFHNAIKERFNGSPVSMSQNFRSDKKIISFVNTLFKSIFAPDQLERGKRLIAIDYEASHQDLESMSKEEGSVSFLVTCANDEEKMADTEATNLALFVKNILERDDFYPDIAQKIRENKPAIAIVYDAKSKMLTLKNALYDLGIECKVSASESYYAKEEISDLFFVLKSIALLRRESDIGELSATHKYYLAGALRSKIIRFSDKEVHDLFSDEVSLEWFTPWCKKSRSLSLHHLIQELLRVNNAYSAYAQLDNYEQRLANIEELLAEAIAYESVHGNDLDGFVYRLEQHIFHAQSEEDEAFYRSTTAGSIELCSIHSTKGLAYPMVIVTDSAKALTSQVTAESIKFNTFKDTMNDHYNLVGFKIDEYEPLSLRLLKEVDKRKHMAEKKRLYYVALTRAQNHLILSANLKPTKDGVGSIKNSYLDMTLQSIGITKEQMFNKSIHHCPYGLYYREDLNDYPSEEIVKEFVKSPTLSPITFEAKMDLSATSGKTGVEVRDPALERAALRGTMVHKALELFWDRLEEDDVFEALFAKEAIEDKELRSEIVSLARNFIHTDLYSVLKSGAHHMFEYRFDEQIDNQRVNGSIDLIYHDESADGWIIIDFKSGKVREDHGYDEQLAFYRNVLESKQIKVIEARLCWLG